MLRVSSLTLCSKFASRVFQSCLDLVSSQGACGQNLKTSSSRILPSGTRSTSRRNFSERNDKLTSNAVAKSSLNHWISLSGRNKMSEPYQQAEAAVSVSNGVRVAVEGCVCLICQPFLISLFTLTNLADPVSRAMAPFTPSTLLSKSHVESKAGMASMRSS
jgi:hypothetical protein